MYGLLTGTVGRFYDKTLKFIENLKSTNTCLSSAHEGGPACTKFFSILNSISLSLDSLNSFSSLSLFRTCPGTGWQTLGLEQFVPDRLDEETGVEGIEV